MEKYSKWRDPSTGVAPFLRPLPASTESLPPALVYLAWPFKLALILVRVTLFVLLLLVQVTLCDGLLALLSFSPPLHYTLTRGVNAILCRAILFVIGVGYISTETVSSKRTGGRATKKAPFEPKQGNLIVSNSSSWIDLVYLSFRHNATFLAPVADSTTSSIVGWKCIALWQAIARSGQIPDKVDVKASEKGNGGKSLQECAKTAAGPVVCFPECTTSNNRALLRFADFAPSNSVAAATSFTGNVFVMAFKYPQPTRLSPSLTYPQPPSNSPWVLPFAHLSTLCSIPALYTFSIRRLDPTESQTRFGSNATSAPGNGATKTGRGLDWEGVGEAISTLGRFKRTAGLGWKEKEGFFEFRERKGR
ncbi:hypothetical protein JCM10212_002035 [Sporobolomyces blumeae]